MLTRQREKKWAEIVKWNEEEVERLKKFLRASKDKEHQRLMRIMIYHCGTVLAIDGERKAGTWYT